MRERESDVIRQKYRDAVVLPVNAHELEAVPLKLFLHCHFRMETSTHLILLTTSSRHVILDKSSFSWVVLHCDDTVHDKTSLPSFSREADVLHEVW